MHGRRKAMHACAAAAVVITVSHPTTAQNRGWYAVLGTSSSYDMGCAAVVVAASDPQEAREQANGLATVLGSSIFVVSAADAGNRSLQWGLLRWMAILLSRDTLRR